MDSENNATPISSWQHDQDRSKIPSSGDEKPVSDIRDSGLDELTRILTQHADHAKTEVSVYRKLLDELKKIANQQP